MSADDSDKNPNFLIYVIRLNLWLFFSFSKAALPCQFMQEDFLNGVSAYPTLQSPQNTWQRPPCHRKPVANRSFHSERGNRVPVARDQEKAPGTEAPAQCWSSRRWCRHHERILDR